MDLYFGLDSERFRAGFQIDWSRGREESGMYRVEPLIGVLAAAAVIGEMAVMRADGSGVR